MEKIASVQHEDDPKEFFEALRARRHQFYGEGSDKGVNFSLEVAIAIARREVALSHGPDEHGVALNDLGNALETLGERESGTGKLEQAVAAYREALNLEEAVAAYREALKELTQTAAPQWDRVQEHVAAIGARRAHQSSDALLVGKLFDDRGNRMSSTWARKGPKR